MCDKEEASIIPRAISVPSFQAGDVFPDKSQSNALALMVTGDANGVNAN